MSAITVETTNDLAVVTIDRPQARNAISLDTMEELETALDAVVGGGASVLALRGAGDRAFVSGGDLKELAALRTEDEAAEMARRMRRLLDRLAGLPMPTVAVLNGHAFGGGAEVAAACDLRVAAGDVTIAFNQVRLAIMPAWGGLERLVELVGRSAALELLLTGSSMSADDAQALGLVNQVLPRDGFDEAWRAYALGIASLPRSVSLSIKAAVESAAANVHPHLEDQSVAGFARLWAADDHWSAVEAMSASRRRATEGKGNRDA